MAAVVGSVAVLYVLGDVGGEQGAGGCDGAEAVACAQGGERGEAHGGGVVVDVVVERVHSAVFGE